MMYNVEHHSNVVECTTGDGDTDKIESLSVSWKSPYIITTLVQLLNTLFSGKICAIVRMNSLENSIIIIDEVQSLPIKLFAFLILQ